MRGNLPGRRLGKAAVSGEGRGLDLLKKRITHNSPLVWTAKKNFKERSNRMKKLTVLLGVTLALAVIVSPAIAIIGGEIDNTPTWARS
jgi:hypothetical protein